ncbi:2-hydroxyacid dehydrogenase [Propionispora hippei]|uniref:D-3-phosphoglycerate dehydrogenase n=1 Tax=Propionispora hippei DSM 15287 TaxID=1123003 RepID=A0A1M6KGJ4_9FIRM|nr:2-hydroxyacid dehydrogenase [Propionispora hippei]SHJ58126.1 D-3-phosphoglycerate dehydrogenase [Propionispora hippei DSM 15287]
MKFLVVGDPMLSSETLGQAVRDIFGQEVAVSGVDWKPASDEEFWHLRSQVEKLGPDAGQPPAELTQAILDADIVITHHTPLNGALIRSSKARYIGVCRAGVENIDVAAAKEKGIQVMRTMGRNAEAVSDFTIALMLAELRNLARGHAALRRGEWKKKYPNSAFMGDMKGKTVGLVGFGYIGKLVARKLSSFNMRLIAYDPFVKEEVLQESQVEKVSLEELCHQADFISLHARLSKETAGLIGKREFALMKPTAYVINTARAGLIDEQALVEALQNGQIGGAGLDVFWTEPIADKHPLLSMENVTITPHLAGATNDTFRMTPYLLLEELKKVVVQSAASAWFVK